MTTSPVTDALKAMRARQTLLESQCDAVTTLVNALDERLDAVDARITLWADTLSGRLLEAERAINAKEARQEAERHA